MIRVVSGWLRAFSADWVLTARAEASASATTKSICNANVARQKIRDINAEGIANLSITGQSEGPQNYSHSGAQVVIQIGMKLDEQFLVVHPYYQFGGRKQSQRGGRDPRLRFPIRPSTPSSLPPTNVSHTSTRSKKLASRSRSLASASGKLRRRRCGSCGQDTWQFPSPVSQRISPQRSSRSQPPELRGV
jgi:hypothetical protein